MTAAVAAGWLGGLGEAATAAERILAPRNGALHAARSRRFAACYPRLRGWYRA
jgi:hypothetical protein